MEVRSESGKARQRRARGPLPDPTLNKRHWQASHKYDAAVSKDHPDDALGRRLARLHTVGSTGRPADEMR